MWPNSEQTQELLNSAANGEDTAVNLLMEKHRESLRRMIRARMDRAIAQRVDASDVVQDVLMEASNRLSEFLQQDQMPFHVWLRQLAKDRMIDMHRRHRGAQRRSVDREQRMHVQPFPDQSSLDLAGQLQDEELTPAAAVIRQELQRRFLEALEQLPEEDREMIMLRHFEHLGNTEAAEVLNLSPAAAGMRHLRALRKLRGILGENPSQFS